MYEFLIPAIELTKNRKSRKSLIIQKYDLMTLTLNLTLGVFILINYNKLKNLELIDKDYLLFVGFTQSNKEEITLRSPLKVKVLRT